ncbi:hypothetical protein VPH35_034146 [Triticum aestivum]
MEQRIAELEKCIEALEAGAAKCLEGSHPVRQLEERVARLEVDHQKQTAQYLRRGRSEDGDARAETGQGVVRAVQGGAAKLNNLQVRCGTSSDQIQALAVASAARDIKVDKQHVQCLLQIKKNTWKVACAVLLAFLW